MNIKIRFFLLIGVFYFFETPSFAQEKQYPKEALSMIVSNFPEQFCETPLAKNCFKFSGSTCQIEVKTSTDNCNSKLTKPSQLTRSAIIAFGENLGGCVVPDLAEKGWAIEGSSCNTEVDNLTDSNHVSEWDIAMIKKSLADGCKQGSSKGRDDPSAEQCECISLDLDKSIPGETWEKIAKAVRKGAPINTLPDFRVLLKSRY
ncbi:hypothetical protein RO575_00240 [Methylomonas sp. MO1]|uniref:hypothetical protein n=1 Tax=Methylomonas sp. MO1 TaxID=3073619 RepID=UPI0028A42C0C|nr:hypothetical protein [Methylomonas sp. MO1]MDT4287980.1 hypothetical protein [Methylomonas sp. MO1]